MTMGDDQPEALDWWQVATAEVLDMPQSTHPEWGYPAEGGPRRHHGL
jgi:hypothetical protein